MSWCDYAPLQPPGSAIAVQGLSPPLGEPAPSRSPGAEVGDPHPAAGTTVASRCPLAVPAGTVAISPLPLL
eukprot:7118019-Heterocapsa_arctica.AAC.1